MGELLILGAIIVFGGGIAIILKKGFNEIIKALDSIDARLKKTEEKQSTKA